MGPAVFAPIKTFNASKRLSAGYTLAWRMDFLILKRHGASKNSFPYFSLHYSFGILTSWKERRKLIECLLVGTRPCPKTTPVDL